MSRPAATYDLFPSVFDLRLVPVAYGLGHVVGLLVAWVNSFRRGTTLSHEARELPLQLGLVAAMGYVALLARGLLSVP